jgi:hypothetical protein
MARVERPSTDPFFGEDGPLSRAWQSRRDKLALS